MVSGKRKKREEAQERFYKFYTAVMFDFKFKWNVLQKSYGNMRSIDGINLENIIIFYVAIIKMIDVEKVFDSDEHNEIILMTLEEDFEKIDLKMCRNAQINFLAVGYEGDAIGIEASRSQEILFVGRCAVECMHKWVDNEDFLSDLYNCISAVIESRPKTKKSQPKTKKSQPKTKKSGPWG